jgi:hypothetical protein
VIAGAYDAAMSAFLQRCRAEAYRGGIDYALLSTGEPPERALRGWLVRRAARAAAPVGTGGGHVTGTAGAAARSAAQPDGTR